MKKAVELSENVREAGKNMSSSIVPIRVVGEKQKVDMEMIRKMKIPYSIKDNQVILTVLGVTDNGADTGVEIDRLRKILGKDRLADAASGLQGVNSTSSDKERNIITILTVDNDPINIDVRSVRDLGISKNANVTYMKAVKNEFNISKKNEDLFIFNNSEHIMLLISTKTGSLLGNRMEPEKLMKLGLKVPILSPDLIMWNSKLTSKLYITGPVGVNPELIRKDINYPVFRIYNQTNKTADKVKRTIDAKDKQRDKEIKRLDQKSNLSKMGKDSKTEHHKYLETKESNEEKHNFSKKNKAYTRSPLILIAEIINQNPYANCTDKIYLDENETLIIESEDKVHFTRADSLDLERFLQTEAGIEQKLQRRCELHKSTCNACELLSQQANIKEYKLIEKIWDNVKAVPIENDKLEIIHEYCYREPVEETYAPEKSNYNFAKTHSRNTIERATKKGILDKLDEQI